MGDACGGCGRQPPARPSASASWRHAHGAKPACQGCAARQQLHGLTPYCLRQHNRHSLLGFCSIFLLNATHKNCLPACQGRQMSPSAASVHRCSIADGGNTTHSRPRVVGVAECGGGGPRRAGGGTSPGLWATPLHWAYSIGTRGPAAAGGVLRRPWRWRRCCHSPTPRLRYCCCCYDHYCTLRHRHNSWPACDGSAGLPGAAGHNSGHLTILERL